MTALQFIKRTKPLGLSPSNLGRAIGKTASMIHAYRKGYPTNRTLDLALEALLSRKSKNKDLYS